MILSGLFTACAGAGPDPIPLSTASPPPTSTTTTAAPAQLPPPTTAPATTATPPETTYLIWASGGLPADFLTDLVLAFDPVSVVRGDNVDLVTPKGLVPLDALAIDLDAHRPFLAGTALTDMQPGDLVVGESAANRRGWRVGDTLDLSSGISTVAVVAPDEDIHHAEILLVDGPEVTTARFALVSSPLDQAGFEAEARSIASEKPFRILREGDVPWFRHADGVLPQTVLKDALGEFAYEPTTGSSFVQDPEFREQRIGEATVPLLGKTVCHVEVLPQLEGGMEQVIEEGHQEAIDPTDYAGCWSPRFIAGGPGSPVSRHAWGAAVDLNASANPIGTDGSQDPDLVRIMEEWGFTWGGRWLVPDPMHFEYYPLDP